MRRLWRGVRAFIQWWDLQTAAGIIILLGLGYVAFQVVLVILGFFGHAPVQVSCDTC